MDLFSSPPPLAPPTSEETRLNWFRLLRSRRVGPSTFFRLMDEHGSAEACVDALPKVAAAAGVENYRICPVDVVKAELRAGHRAGADPLFFGSPPYPAALQTMPDRPPILWAKGNTDLLQRPMIAIVGARNASSLGRRMARALARDLAQAGFAIVSGLARGIDAEAHSAALEAGTIAVVAGGIDTVYPEENRKLTQDIAAQGLLLTEQPPGLNPQARHFPRRNRIVAGLAKAVIVVEAAAKSGSLITARAALDMGTEVMAIPGHPFDARASGGNLLIRDGALLIRSAQDVIEALSDLGHQSADQRPRQSKAATPPETPASPAADRTQEILSLLDSSPVSVDQLARDLSMPAAEMARVIVTLELDGQVDRHPGGMIARAG